MVCRTLLKIGYSRVHGISLQSAWFRRFLAKSEKWHSVFILFCHQINHVYIFFHIFFKLIKILLVSIDGRFFLNCKFTAQLLEKRHFSSRHHRFLYWNLQFWWFVSRYCICIIINFDIDLLQVQNRSFFLSTICNSCFNCDFIRWLFNQVSNIRLVHILVWAGQILKIFGYIFLTLLSSLVIHISIDASESFFIFNQH